MQHGYRECDQELPKVVRRERESPVHKGSPEEFVRGDENVRDIERDRSDQYK